MKFLRIKNSTGGKPAEMYITGDIEDDRMKGWSWGDDASTYPADIKNMLNGLDGEDLTLYINSGGGDVFAGMAMAAMLERYPGKKTAVVDGLCASIATQIMFACDVVQIPENAYIMIHKPSTMESGDADTLRKTADLLDKLQDGIEVRYQKWAKDGVTPDQIKEMVNNATWMSGDDAAQTFNVATTAPLKAVACIGGYAARLKNRPAGIVIKDAQTANLEPPKPPAVDPLSNHPNPPDSTKLNDEVSVALALASVF